jgi:hypothetical protein
MVHRHFNILGWLASSNSQVLNFLPPIYLSNLPNFPNSSCRAASLQTARRSFFADSLKSFVCRVVFVLCLQFEVLLQGFSEGFDRVFEQKAAAALKA